MDAARHAWTTLLALQFGLQPHVARAFLPDGVSKASVALATEITKLLLAAISLRSARACIPVTPASLRSPFGRRKLLAVCLPSATYALQNVCLHHAYVTLDAVTFNCLNQLKIAFAALFVFLLTGSSQSPQQCAALFLLICAGFLVQLRSGLDSPSRSSSVSGVALALATSALSGLGSSLTQLATHRFDLSALLLTAHMACLQAPFLTAQSLYDSNFQLFPLVAHWNLLCAIPVVMQALGGMVVGKVTRELGAVSKAFGIVAGLVLTGIAESAIHLRPLELKQLAALVLVSYATYLYYADTGSKRGQSSLLPTQREATKKA